jgi:tetratricopeptide (TPR) repeat protein
MFFGLLTFSILVLLFLPPAWESQVSAVCILGTVLFGVCALAWLGWSRVLTLSQISFGPAFLMLIAAWTLSALLAEDLALSLNTLAQTLSLWLLFFLAFLFSHSLRMVKNILGWFLLAAALLAVFGLYQYAGGLSETYLRLFGTQAPQGFLERELANRLLSGRAFSLFVYPNVFAGFLAMLLPLGLALLMSARRRAQRWLWGLVLAVLAAGLFSTQSLGGWLAATAGVGLFYLFLSDDQTLYSGRRWSLGIWLTGLICIVSGLWLMINHRGYMAAWEGLSRRWVHWKVALKMLWDHPFFGVGPGLFGSVYPQYQQAGDYARFAHNTFFQTASETGCIGVAALGYFLFKIFQMVRQGWAPWKNNPNRIILIGLASAVSAAVLHALGDVDFQFLKNAVVVMVLLGMLAGLIRQAGLQPAAEVKIHPLNLVPGNSWLVGLTTGLGCVLVLVLWRGGHSIPLGAMLIWSIGLLWIAWMFLSSQAGRLMFRAVPLRWLFGFLWVWGIISASVSSHPAAAVPGLTLALTGFLAFALIWEWAPVSFSLIWVLIGSSGILSLAALGMAWKMPGGRMALNWPNPNLLAAYLAMGLIAALGLYSAWDTAWRRKGWLLGVSAVLALGLFTTGSMGGWLNVLTGWSVLSYWWVRQRRVPWWGAMAGLLALVFLGGMLPLALGQRLGKIHEYSGPLYERLHMAGAAIQMSGDYPLTGVGPGNFNAVFEQYSFPNVRGLARYGKTALFAHNELLQILAVLGIPGLVVLLAVLSLAALRFRNVVRQPPPPASAGWQGAVPLAVSAALAGACAQAMVDFNWHLPALWIWGLALLGMMFAQPAVKQAPLDQTVLWAPGQAVRHPLSLILILVGITALLAASRPLLSEYYLAQGEAQRYKKNLKNAAQDYQRALVVYPLSASAYDRLGQAQSDFYATSGAGHWFALGEWAYRKALMQNGLDPYIHRHLGQMYALKASQLSGIARQRYYTQAVDEYREAVRKAPHQAFLLFEMGNVFRDAGQWSEAEESWRQAVELEPHYAAAWSNLGVVQELRGNTQSAEASYRQALDLRQYASSVRDKYEIELFSLNDAVVYYNLAQLLERQGRWAEAKEKYAAVLRLEPAHSLARRRWQALRRIVP